MDVKSVTLNEIRSHGENDWGSVEDLIMAMGGDVGDEEPIPLAEVVDFSLNYALWVLAVVKRDSKAVTRFALYCARQANVHHNCVQAIGNLVGELEDYVRGGQNRKEISPLIVAIRLLEGEIARAKQPQGFFFPSGLQAARWAGQAAVMQRAGQCYAAVEAAHIVASFDGRNPSAEVIAQQMELKKLCE